MGTVT